MRLGIRDGRRRRARDLRRHLHHRDRRTAPGARARAVESRRHRRGRAHPVCDSTPPASKTSPEVEPSSIGAARFSGFLRGRTPSSATWHTSITAVPPTKASTATRARAGSCHARRAFFPRSAALFRREIEPHPESRARLVLHLPSGWDSATVFPSDGPNRYVVETPHQRLDHPRGWVLLGHMKRIDTDAAGTALTIARAPGVTHKVDHAVQLLDPNPTLARDPLRSDAAAPPHRARAGSDVARRLER